MPETARVIAPPPLLFGGTLALGLALHWLAPIPGLGLGPRRYLPAGLLILAGLAIPLAAIRHFARAGTPPEPWEPTTALVTTGPYRATRNPMYLGMALTYAGVALAFDSLAALALLPPLLALVTRGVILREERYMAARFGEPYRAYRARVRRWL